VLIPVSAVKLPTRWEKFSTWERVIYIQLNPLCKHPPKPPSAGNHIQLLQTGAEFKLIRGKCCHIVQETTLYRNQCAGFLFQLLSLL